MHQDEDAIKALVERYRSLSPDALAALDDERHQLSAAEVTALDVVKASDEMGEAASKSIRKLDIGKQRRFRIAFIALVLAVIISVPIIHAISNDAGDFAVAQALALLVAAVAAESIYRLWEAWRDWRRSYRRPS